MESPNGEQLALAIKTGAYDPHLLDLADAIAKRFTHSDTAKRWRFDWTSPDGEHRIEVTEDDLTVDEAAKIEKITGKSWAELNPMRSANHARAIGFVMLRDRLGLKQDDAEQVLKQMTVVDAVDSISEYQVSPAPLDSPPSTTS